MNLSYCVSEILFCPEALLKMLSGITRSKAVLPFRSAQSNMVEVCSLPLRAMYIAQLLGAQRVYVAIKQVVAFSLQTPLKCSIAGLPKRIRVICAAESRSLLKGTVHFFAATSESGSLFIKELCLCLLLANRACPRKSCYQKDMLNSVLLYLEYIFKLSQILHGYSQSHWHASLLRLAAQPRNNHTEIIMATVLLSFHAFSMMMGSIPLQQ